MKHIKNFVKFAIIITILEFINEFTVGTFELVSHKVDSILGYSLLTIILIFIALKRKYIIFKKNDWKQNLISIGFILFSLLWFYFIMCISLIFLLGTTFYYYGF